MILSRLQLFTENTITVVLPILARPRRSKFIQAAKLWGIVFMANMVGTFLAALLAIFAGTTTPELTESMLEISRHFAESSGVTALLLGIPAGYRCAGLDAAFGQRHGAICDYAVHIPDRSLRFHPCDRWHK